MNGKVCGNVLLQPEKAAKRSLKQIVLRLDI